MDDRGQLTPLVALLVVVAGAVSLGLGRLAGLAVDRARAQTAADAAALAGVTAGEPSARRLAEANGAELVQFGRLGGDVRVVVRLRSAEARARARPGLGRSEGR